MSSTSSTNNGLYYSLCNPNTAILPGETGLFLNGFIKKSQETTAPRVASAKFFVGSEYIPQANAGYPWFFPLPSEQDTVKLTSSINIIDNTQQGDGNFHACIDDALKRYQEINNGAVFDTSKIDNFMQILKKVCTKMELQPFIIFNKFATKIELSFNEKKFTIDYDHDEIDNLFIMTSINGTLIVKECTLDKMEETLRSF